MNRFYMKFLLLISLIILLVLLISNNHLLYKIEALMLEIINNSQPTVSLELNYLSSNIKKYYNDKQKINNLRNNISIEELREMVDSNKLKKARKASFHNINDCGNLKYLSKDGHFEYIVKATRDEDGKYLFIDIVKDPINRGTYNFFNQEGNWWNRLLHHVDVNLWLLYGTGYDDKSTISDRLFFYFTRKGECGDDDED